jgi:ankyrin repeat protein
MNSEVEYAQILRNEVDVVKFGTVEYIRYLLELRKFGLDIVYTAVIEGRVEIVQLLYPQLYPDSNCQSYYLDLAARYDRIEIVKLIFTLGVEDWAKGKALEEACRQGSLEIVELLLRAQANIGRSLDVAAIEGYSDIVRLLLQKGARATPTTVRAGISSLSWKTVQILFDEGSMSLANVRIPKVLSFEMGKLLQDRV